jgi:hypothetical protein
MPAAVESSVPNEPHPLKPTSSWVDTSGVDASIPSDLANEQNTSTEPAPNASFVDLLIPKHTIMTPPSPVEDVHSSNLAAVPSETILQSPPESTTQNPEGYSVHTEIAEPSDLFRVIQEVSEESLPDKPIYPPPVSPTQTYQPLMPSLSMMHATKSPTSVKPPTSIFNRRSWHPSEYERTSAPISPITSSSGKMNRSVSNASSGASSAYSANSATIQIPQPGTNAYTKKFYHKRQQSDPKYVRFMSAVSENQKRTEPERYVGYPGLVSHMSETQSLIFRRFDEVHVRLLLYLQDQICQLETQLRTLDERNIAEKGMHNGTFREDVDRVRVEILERLRMLVGEYDTMILAFSRMQESKASDKAIGRLKDWLKKYSGAPAGRQSPTKGGSIAKNELEWVEKTSDLSNFSVSTSINNAVVKQSTLTRLFPGKKR